MAIVVVVSASSGCRGAWGRGLARVCCSSRGEVAAGALDGGARVGLSNYGGLIDPTFRGAGGVD